MSVAPPDRTPSHTSVGFARPTRRSVNRAGERVQGHLTYLGWSNRA
jgi:hypothetical protein